MENSNTPLGTSATDFSYLTPKPVEAPRQELAIISQDLKRKAEQPSFKEIGNQYSVASLNNLNVDKRLDAVDYSTKFSDAYDTLSDGTPIAR